MFNDRILVEHAVEEIKAEDRPDAEELGLAVAAAGDPARGTPDGELAARSGGRRWSAATAGTLGATTLREQFGVVGRPVGGH